jgi:transposase InsO family protein
MQEHRKDWPLKVMCRALEVSRSGYYAWCDRPPSARFHRRAVLSAAIREAHAAGRKTYGSPRVTAALKKKGVACCVNTVAKIMRNDGLAAKIKRRFKVTTDSAHDLPTAPNRLNRCFVQERPNQAWVSDITFIATEEGWLYLATEMDLYSRKIVGWAMSERLTTELVASALTMAIAQRQPPVGLLHHSDRGCQFASGAFRQLLAAQDAVCSMSRRGNAYDNAPMESFYATLKRELVHPTTYATRNQARASVFEYIEVFYNRQRLHSALGYQSPVEFEARGQNRKPSVH